VLHIVMRHDESWYGAEGQILRCTVWYDNAATSMDLNLARLWAFMSCS